MDLVGTCPKDFWDEWLTEGDCAGEACPNCELFPEICDCEKTEYYWRTRARLASLIKRGDRFYIVAHGKLRGYAPVTDIKKLRRRVWDGQNWQPDPRGGFDWSIIRQGDAVACTIIEKIRGFPGLRKRWWRREEERLFLNWKIP